ncbi:unnamed protein product [Rotaria sp. Silwood1]|nr:unnamed protein product [Rotaria sp. Silwood1]CAF1353355.1 unnamed protein product [Rotaria sp. Silwood1]CAF1355815.1 unnamed protein product [Rotaria sp. Silwood1]CAF3514540.1 unnamed protein product [Rotaria sp. Silwood1]CAF3550587.1 unnamed protein product [Rotaria sp. Silwood1]
MTGTPGRSPGSFRGYTNEQKTLRSKLDLIIKWGRDLKSNIMKQSCKALQTTNTNTRETIDQIHDDLDDYKRKLDRELGLIHDICDALTIDNQLTNGDEENLHDEILEALRRSPTYTSLEQHIFDDQRPRIRTSTIPSSSQQQNTEDDNSQIIDDSDDEIIALSDEDTPGRSNSSPKKVIWTSSEIQITSSSSQSQSLHNPYRIGIADPSIRSIFLPPPNSQTMSTSSGGSKRSQGSNRKISPTKRTTGTK